MSNTTPLKKPDLSILAASWPSPFIAREEVERFTGGAISKKYLSNLDSAGKGIPQRLRVGRKVLYRVTDLVSWLESRAEVISDGS